MTYRTGPRLGTMSSGGSWMNICGFLVYSIWLVYQTPIKSRYRIGTSWSTNRISTKKAKHLWFPNCTKGQSVRSESATNWLKVWHLFNPNSSFICSKSVNYSHNLFLFWIQLNGKTIKFDLLGEMRNYKNSIFISLGSPCFFFNVCHCNISLCSLQIS